MLRRRLALAALGLAAYGATGSDVPLYFGRTDLARWALAHPVPKPPEADRGPHRVSLLETRRIVPSAGLPAKLRLHPANNNLDAVRHGGFTYLAFRSAPSHFASEETVLQVLKSADERSWTPAARFALGRDLREPRFLVRGDRLIVYASVLGTNPFDFEPEGVRAAVQGADGSFGPLEPIDLPGRIAWRTRQIADRAYMTAYVDGERLYSLTREPMSVEWLTTSDGLSWEAVDPERRVVSQGGGSEADFGFTADGSLFAVIRNEAGDASGFGSKLCRAPRERLGDWRCTPDPRKYDSPNVFAHDGEIYVFARRHLTANGSYDVAGGPELVRMLRNQLAYIVEGKRCALWRYDPARQALGFVLDLPSRGDTCFAAVLPGETPDSLVVYDYSSDVDGPELPWTVGQRRPTNIYRHVLSFTRAQPL